MTLFEKLVEELKQVTTEFAKAKYTESEFFGMLIVTLIERVFKFTEENNLSLHPKMIDIGVKVNEYNDIMFGIDKDYKAYLDQEQLFRDQVNKSKL